MTSFSIYNHKPQVGALYCAGFFLHFLVTSFNLFHMSTDLQSPPYLPTHRWQFPPQNRTCLGRISILPWTHHPVGMLWSWTLCLFPPTQGLIYPCSCLKTTTISLPPWVKCYCYNTPLSKFPSMGSFPSKHRNILYYTPCFKKRKKMSPLITPSPQATPPLLALLPQLKATATLAASTASPQFFFQVDFIWSITECTKHKFRVKWVVTQQTPMQPWQGKSQHIARTSQGPLVPITSPYLPKGDQLLTLNIIILSGLFLTFLVTA